MSGFVNYTAPQPSRNRWAEALNRLSIGLGGIAKMHEESENEKEKNARMDAREAAQRAFQDNLTRFTQGEESKRAKEAQAHEDSREHERTTTASADREAQRTQHDQDEKDRVRHEKAMEGIEGGRSAAENARAKTAEDRAAASDKRAADNEDKNRAATALHSTEADLNATIASKRDIEKQLSDPMMKFDKSGQSDALRKQLDDLNSQIGGLQTDLRDLRHRSGYTSSLDAKSGDGSAAKLPPDRQQLYDDLKAKNPGKDPSAILDQVKGMPQQQLDSIMKLRPTADTGSSGSPDASGGGSIAADSGPGRFMAEGDPAVASTAAPQPSVPDQGGAPPEQADALTNAEPPGADQSATASNAMASTGGAPDSGTGMGDEGAPPTTDEQVDQSKQFEGMKQQLDQSPQGQAVHATLDRLASTDNGVQQQKFERQAQIQLQDLFPDQDPDAYIGWYTSQQQQEPEYS